MNEYCTLLIVAIFTTGFSMAQGNTISFGDGTNEPKTIQQNSIKKEVIYKYSFNSNGVNDSTLTNTFYYDSAGYIVKEILAKIDNYDESVTEYINSYTDDGKLKRQFKNAISIQMIHIYEYDYNLNGNEINKYEYNKDTTDLRIDQKIYNDKKQVIQLQTKINNNDFYVSRKYYYDNDSNLIRTDAFDKKGGYLYSYIYEYNKAENKKTSYLNNSDGKILEGEYFYNDKNQLVKIKNSIKMTTFLSQERADNNMVNQLRENIYNADNTLFETNIYLDGKKAQTTRHYYFKY